jgi:hypothetical protein
VRILGLELERLDGKWGLATHPAPDVLRHALEADKVVSVQEIDYRGVLLTAWMVEALDGTMTMVVGPR